MLVLTRKLGQQICIGDQIKLTIVKTQGKTVRLGIEAPRDIRIVRAELAPLPQSEAKPKSKATAERESLGHPSPSVHSAEPVRSERLPGRDAINRSRTHAPSHPLRWTVASMQERVRSQRGPSSGAVASHDVR